MLFRSVNFLQFSLPQLSAKKNLSLVLLVIRQPIIIKTLIFVVFRRFSISSYYLIFYVFFIAIRLSSFRRRRIVILSYLRLDNWLHFVRRQDVSVYSYQRRICFCDFISRTYRTTIYRQRYRTLYSTFFAIIGHLYIDYLRSFVSL